MWGVIIRSGVRVALAAAAFASIVLLGSPVALGVPESVRQHRAEAERVLAQIQELDIELEEAVEAWNAANLRLGELEQDIEANRRRLAIARRAHKIAQQNLADRLVALYTTGEASTLEIILGAASLDELLDRLDSAERISDQDVRIVQQVQRARAEMRLRERKLERARAEQRQAVAARGERRAYIEERLSERQTLYESIKDEIAQLEAEERERQRRLAEEQRRRQEEQQRITAAAVEAGVDTSAVIATPEGIGTAPASRYGSDVVSIALQYLGVPYVWGGASPSAGFDCSGLVVYAFAQAGRPGLPHYTGSLWQLGVPVSYSQLQPGDLVWFYSGGHMGIYMGGGQMVHAPRTGDVVKISDISPGSHYYSAFLGARRIT